VIQVNLSVSGGMYNVTSGNVRMSIDVGCMVCIDCMYASDAGIMLTYANDTG